MPARRNAARRWLKAKASPPARQKAASKRTAPLDGETLPVHSFPTLLADLATLTCNHVAFGADRADILLAVPTKLQRAALNLLGVRQLA